MLSLLVCVKDQEEAIKRVISSAKGLVSEIVVVDSGSKDATVENARALGAKVVFNPWQGYPRQLNFGISLCKNDWILILDSDEELSKELKESIAKELKNPRYSAYYLCRRPYYLGGFLNHGWYPEWRLRLFKKGVVTFEGNVHERPIISTKTGKLKGDIYHFSFKDLKEQYEKNIKYAHLMAIEMKTSGKKFRLWNLILNPLWHFVKVYFLKLGFLDGTRGFLAASSGSIYTFLKYKFLYELERTL
ncbi:MAG: glycosyltransferase family 2 protein [Aquificaceae bacterium]|nr:glycosyltransferase family 2 protein [Aquificaceae bacterium]MDW8236948.1 glycosyltransferase family 2 protein [Aquificaceae bacterium]